MTDEPCIVVIVNGMRISIRTHNNRVSRQVGPTLGMTGTDLFFADTVNVGPLDEKFSEHVDAHGCVIPMEASQDEWQSAHDMLQRLCASLANAQELKEFVAQPPQQVCLGVELALLNERRQNEENDAKLRQHLLRKVVQRVEMFKKQEERNSAPLSTNDKLLEKLETMICQEFDRTLIALREKNSILTFEDRVPFYKFREEIIAQFKEAIRKSLSKAENIALFDTLRKDANRYFSEGYMDGLLPWMKERLIEPQDFQQEDLKRFGESIKETEKIRDELIERITQHTQEITTANDRKAS